MALEKTTKNDKTLHQQLSRRIERRHKLPVLRMKRGI